MAMNPNLFRYPKWRCLIKQDLEELPLQGSGIRQVAQMGRRGDPDADRTCSVGHVCRITGDSSAHVGSCHNLMCYR